MGRAKAGADPILDLVKDAVKYRDWVQHPAGRASVAAGRGTIAGGSRKRSQDDEKYDAKRAWLLNKLPNKFTCLEFINSGTFGKVFCGLAHGLPNGGPPLMVALKSHMPNVAVASIIKEAEILVKLGGQNNVVGLLAGENIEGQRFFVHPYIKHDQFHKITAEATLADVKKYLQDLFTALAHVHRHNIIHRDVKPSNFLYSLEERRGCLVDFGLAEEWDGGKRKRHAEMSVEELEDLVKAKRAKPRGTAKSAAPEAKVDKKNASKEQKKKWENLAPSCGTRGYRAPEIAGRSYYQTPAVDVWAAGAMMLMLFTRKTHFFDAPKHGKKEDHKSALAAALREHRIFYGNEALVKMFREVHRMDVQFKGVPEKADDPLFPRLNADMLRGWTPDNADKAHDIPDEGINLLKRCLDANLETRITAADALKHPFLAKP